MKSEMLVPIVTFALDQTLGYHFLSSAEGTYYGNETAPSVNSIFQRLIATSAVLGGAPSLLSFSFNIQKELQKSPTEAIQKPSSSSF